ncbi:flagellar motor protein MotP [Anoxybacter fermentans]|uniref:Flagellar motor protein MotP n=1 Tax=Anoxybacter fermentans TaxID=1323375 RepID=A0A3Q9HRM3_9FIRM|nr:motility protein A [Anoxybacter fermentans]AZR73871.1 flagellar motor protein MotP [Anoxybacter fermentans]
MDLSTVVGLVLGLTLILGAIVMKGNWLIFISIDSAMIVLGGTIAGTLVNYSFGMLKNLIKHTKKVFSDSDHNPSEVIEIMVGFAEKARREGLLALEDEAQELQNEFLKKGIQLVVDGTDPELVKNILQTRLSFLEQTDKKYQEMYKTMATLAPAFGMIGTLIGLIQMLATLDNPDAIASGMATALITTLYGSFLANYLFIPLAGKLKVRSEEEILLMELMIEGLLSIQAGENPRIVEEKLKAFLISEEQELGEVPDEELEMAVGENA